MEFNDLNLQNQVQETKVKSFLSPPKIVFIILGLVILGEVLYAAKVLSFPTPSLPFNKVSQSQVTSLAKISLQSTKPFYSVSETIPISVLIDTSSKTISGADLIIKYDQSILEATNASLIKGTVFDDYPFMSVDSVKGLISISGISNSQNGFTGKGQFATLNLKAKRSGSTTLTIDFKKGSTTNSNLAETNTSKNILEQVDNLQLNIQ